MGMIGAYGSDSAGHAACPKTRAPSITHLARFSVLTGDIHVRGRDRDLESTDGGGNESMDDEPAAMTE
jgi:hypothetical protein